MILEYLECLQKKLELLFEQSEPIHNAATVIAECIKADSIIYALGTGHSHLLAEEIFYRAGGFTNVYPILSEELMLHKGGERSTEQERQQGLARKLLSGYPLTPNDVLIIASNSGINAVPVEAALYAQEVGCKVIAITSLQHSRSVEARNVHNLHLFEVADIVLDNHAPKGDAAVEVGRYKTGPVSTILGAALLNCVFVEAVKQLERENAKPQVFTSANLEHGDDVNHDHILRMKKRIPIL